MSSIREQIVAAAVVALNTGRPADVPEFVRTRVEDLRATQLPANDIHPAQPRIAGPGPGGANSPLVRRAITLRVRMSAGPNAGLGLAPDQAADPSYVWAVKVLSGNRFGGLATGTLEVDPPDEGGFTFRYVDDVPVCEIVADFEVQYQTKTNDATATGA